MSSNELPQRRKRKHSGDETEDHIVKSLRQWKKKELSPESSEQAETLLAAAAQSRDTTLFQSSFDFFEAKQKQKQEAKSNSAALTDKIQDLEAQLHQAKARLEESQAEERGIQAQLSDLHFMLEYGDWFAFFIKAMRPHESEIERQDVSTMEPLLLSAWETRKTQMREAGKAQAAAENRQYVGFDDEQKKDLAEEKKDIHSNAQKAAKWDCLNGRYKTSAHAMIESEKKSVLEWRENGQDESLAPGTPFLDRIERICVEAGISRAQCLDWVRKYAERNATCHNPPPKVSQFWKKDAAGVDMEVEKKDDAHTVIDWAAIKSAVEDRKADIEEKYSNGSLSDERKVYILELMEQFWKFISRSTEPDGTPVPTEFAQTQAKRCWEDRAAAKPNPPQNYLQRYHEGK